MEFEIDGVIYKKVIDFVDDILGKLSHFIYKDSEGYIRSQFFMYEKKDDTNILIKLEDDVNEKLENKYFGGRR